MKDTALIAAPIVCTKLGRRHQHMVPTLNNPLGVEIAAYVWVSWIFINIDKNVVKNLKIKKKKNYDVRLTPLHTRQNTQIGVIQRCHIKNNIRRKKNPSLFGSLTCHITMIISI